MSWSIKKPKLPSVSRSTVLKEEAERIEAERKRLKQEFYQRKEAKDVRAD